MQNFDEITQNLPWAAQNPLPYEKPKRKFFDPQTPPPEQRRDSHKTLKKVNNARDIANYLFSACEKPTKIPKISHLDLDEIMKLKEEFLKTLQLLNETPPSSPCNQRVEHSIDTAKQ